jgi:hypothetical protein
VCYLCDCKVTLEAREETIPRIHMTKSTIDGAWAVVSGHLTGRYIFPTSTGHHFQAYSTSKRTLDELSGTTGWRLHDLRRTIVSGMARMGIPPHVADKILNHQSGTISGVAAVYQRHDFLAERKDALDRWGAHVTELVRKLSVEARSSEASS